jgi:hypothetical protein
MVIAQALHDLRKIALYQFMTILSVMKEPGFEH